MTSARQVVAQRLPVCGKANVGKATTLAQVGAALDQIRAVTKDAVYQAVHDLVDTSADVVAEDLSGLRGKSKFGRDGSCIYPAWHRSFLAGALASVSSRRGSAVTLVNPAYTSQQGNPCGPRGAAREESSLSDLTTTRKK